MSILKLSKKFNMDKIYPNLLFISTEKGLGLHVN